MNSHTDYHDVKIIDWVTATRILSRTMRKDKSLVLVNGTFDWIHIGHISLLEYASTCGDILLVLTNSDESIKRLKGNSRPLINLPHRLKTLSSLHCVDWVAPFYTDTITYILDQLKPDVWVKGSDYSFETIDREEMHVANEVGINIKIMPKIENFSTTSLLEKIRFTGDTT